MARPKFTSGSSCAFNQKLTCRMRHEAVTCFDIRLQNIFKYKMLEFPGSYWRKWYKIGNSTAKSPYLLNCTFARNIDYLQEKKYTGSVVYVSINLLWVTRDGKCDSFNGGNGERHQLLLLVHWLFLPDVPVTGKRYSYMYAPHFRALVHRSIRHKKVIQQPICAQFHSSFGVFSTRIYIYLVTTGNKTNFSGHNNEQKLNRNVIVKFV